MRDRLSRRRVWLTMRRGNNSRPGRFCIEWIDDDGRRRKLAYRSRDEQLAAQREKFAELNSAISPARRQSWALVMLEHGTAHRLLSPKYVGAVATTLARFTRIVQPATADAIHARDVTNYFAQRLAGQPPRLNSDGSLKLGADGKPLPLDIPTLGTIHREYRELSGFFNWCVTVGYLQRSPMLGVKLPQPPRRLPRAPKQDSWVKLLEALNRADIAVDDAQAWHVLILLGVVTGVRQAPLLNTYFGVSLEPGSIAKLQRANPRGFAVVQLADDASGVGLLFSYTGKTCKEEVFGLPPVVNDRVARRITDLPGGAQLFPWSRWQRKAWARISQAAGVRIDFHSLRRVSGTQAGIAQAREAARAHLGHYSAETTRQHYLDSAAVARAVALQQTWPELPAMPRYAPKRWQDIRRLPAARSG